MPTRLHKYVFWGQASESCLVSCLRKPAMNGFCLLLCRVFFNLAKTNPLSQCRLAFWPESSVVRENLLNPWPWGPEALPLIISCFLCVCLVRSPALQNPIYFPHLPPRRQPLLLPKTVCTGALNQVPPVNLKRHGYENISRERRTRAEETSTLCPCSRESPLSVQQQAANSSG